MVKLISIFNLKLHITVLYESLCPDSRNFMPDLEDVYDELGDYLNVELVPFGKSSVSNDILYIVYVYILYIYFYKS